MSARISNMLFKVILAVLSVLISTHVFKLVDKLGYLRYYHRHHPGTCRTIPGVLHGSEDFAVTTKGDVFITTGLTWRFNSPSYRAYAKTKNVKGGMFFFQFSQPEKGVTPLTLKPSPTFDPSLFNPHGIDIIEDETGEEQHTIFVVNHPDSLSDRIEKFRILSKTKELEHLKTYTNELFTNLNDVSALGPDSFYASNMCASVGRVPALLEMLTLLEWGTVLYQPSEGDHVLQVSPAAGGGSGGGGLLHPNGVTLSKDERFLYVSAADELHLYARHKNGSLKLVQELPLHTQLDNIQTHPDGHTIYIGSHPKVHKFVAADEHPEEEVAPSQVLAITVNKEGYFEEKGVTELFYDHGELISGSSVAAVFNGKMLIGTVQDKLAFCDMKYPEH